MTEVLETMDLVRALRNCAEWDGLSPEVKHAFKKLANRLEPLQY